MRVLTPGDATTSNSPQFPSWALSFSLRCWEDAVNSSFEVLEALGGETHYKYLAFIISLSGGTVLRVGEANTRRGRKSECRALGALEGWLLYSWGVLSLILGLSAI